MFIGSLREFQTGSISNIKTSNSKITITLYENQTQLIIFDSNINLQKGDTISFQGKSNIYKGKPQIIVDKIKYLNLIKWTNLTKRYQTI